MFNIFLISLSIDLTSSMSLTEPNDGNGKVKLCDSAAIGAEITHFTIKEWQYRSQNAGIYAIDFMYSPSGPCLG